MKVRLLHTTGNGVFEETEWNKPEPNDYEIEVKSIMTGICRSDIDMMNGEFGPLSIEMSGHEGLGQVIRVGKNVSNVNIGDYVATRGEPAYADIYNVRDSEFVLIPEALPRYIIEPIACGINAVQFKDRNKNDKILIIGSGFLAWVAYHRLINFEHYKNVDVLGTSNRELWNDKLLLGTSESYDIVVDLSGKYSLGIDINLNDNALIVDGVGKAVSKEESQQQLWKSCTTLRPSPRNLNFHQCMKEGVWMIENNLLNVDHFWTKGYNRETEWKKAFEEGTNRKEGYSRGYIFWSN